MSMRLTLAAVLSLAWLGCASDSGSNPGDQSVGQQNNPAMVPALPTDGGYRGLPSVVRIGRSDGGLVGGLDAGAPPSASADGGIDAAVTAYACVQNSDCVVKDVGSCCGYFPGCANLGATFGAPDCSNGRVGTCSLPNIDHCACQQSTCVNVLSAVQGSQ